MKLPDAIFSQHIAVLGKTGSGKTSTAKLVVEHAVKHDDARVCVLDPIKSDWWGLTRSGDGKRAGLPFQIIGGPLGHVPLHAAAGEAVGQVVASGALPLAIIDMADFMPGEHAKFFVAFAHALFRNMKGVLYLVVEEAHIFAPKEKPGFGEESKSTHWMTRIATGARSKGIRLCVCTQRVQALHNAVLGSCETMIAHRLTLPADQEPVKKWLAGNTDKPTAERITASLASLKAGEAWLCSGEARIVERGQLPHIATYDNSATPTAGHGAAEIRPPTVNTQALDSLIGQAIAEAKANDPAELRRRVADLEKQLRARSPSAPSAKSVDTSSLLAKRDDVWRGRVAGYARRVGTALARLDPPILMFKKHLGVLNSTIKEVFRDADGAAELISARDFGPIALAPSHPSHPSHTAASVSSVVKSSSNSRPSGGKHRILVALAQHPAGLTDRALGILAGLSSKGGTFSTYLSALGTAGHIEGDRSCRKITPQGLAAVSDFEPLPTGDDLINYWLKQLGGGAARIFNVLCGEYPQSVTKQDLGDLAGLSDRSGTFGTYLSRLRTLGLVEQTSDGLRASETLFQ
jgi:hypothetical protein